MFPGLRELQLRNKTDEDFMKGSNHSTLCNLNITGNYLHGKIVDTFDIGKAARNFPKLEHLKVTCCKIEISDPKEQFDFPCLQNLELRNVEIDDDNIKILAANLPISIDLTKCLKKI